jgi:hypothetical protein
MHRPIPFAEGAKQTRGTNPCNRFSSTPRVTWKKIMFILLCTVGVYNFNIGPTMIPKEQSWGLHRGDLRGNILMIWCYTMIYKILFRNTSTGNIIRKVGFSPIPSVHVLRTLWEISEYFITLTRLAATTFPKQAINTPSFLCVYV